MYSEILVLIIDTWNTLTMKTKMKEILTFEKFNDRFGEFIDIFDSISDNFIKSELYEVKNRSLILNGSVVYNESWFNYSKKFKNANGYLSILSSKWVSKDEFFKKSKIVSDLSKLLEAFDFKIDNNLSFINIGRKKISLSDINGIIKGPIRVHRDLKDNNMKYEIFIFVKENY